MRFDLPMEESKTSWLFDKWIQYSCTRYLKKGSRWPIFCLLFFLKNAAAKFSVNAFVVSCFLFRRRKKKKNSLHTARQVTATYNWKKMNLFFLERKHENVVSPK